MGAHQRTPLLTIGSQESQQPAQRRVPGVPPREPEGGVSPASLEAVQRVHNLLARRQLCLVLDLDHTLLNSARFTEVEASHTEVTGSLLSAHPLVQKMPRTCETSARSSCWDKDAGIAACISSRLGKQGSNCKVYTSWAA